MEEFDQSDLLGIRCLLEKGQFPKGQFVDLSPSGRSTTEHEPDKDRARNRT